ncbi:transferrin receptor protein 1-like [Pristis pectinata]|uniref:transferrin receptor protein 1-like n=1 Tax=Pristis pectinata TaxID=685728 RepID=UPI00223CC35D|nr:transferrin receptor protein 1-like [Pristis pectinata]XP_051873179.1 transferrin receptor protein 1-like [Pristis pectinata]XP_051873180.1 transferrin receptor protein 1-like [Pristis pectinata]
MDSIRATISNFFGGELRSYTRFSLTRQADGDISRVEMKSADAENDEEMGDGMPDGMQTLIRKPHNKCKGIMKTLMFAIFFPVIGFLVGYLAFRGQTSRALTAVTVPSPEPTVVYDDGDYLNMDYEEVSVLHFSDLQKILQNSLASSDLESKIRKISEDGDHQTGSNGDLTNTKYVREEFSKMLQRENVWFDTHYVTLQVNSKSPNRVWIVDGANERELELEEKNSNVYCPYSANGTFTGKLVYANYGTEDDFKELQKQVNVNGTVVIVRVGKISFAEKVFNAEKMKAGGVLIYPDSRDYQLDGDVAMFGHVHMGLGDPRTPGFPSFNHTQFPPTRSSGLPGILAHSISANVASHLLHQLGGADAPASWQGIGTKLGPGFAANDGQVKLEINNVEEMREMHNVFGVIKGNEEMDHYVVIGAQRDSYGPGAAESGVGTALLLELARVFSKMVEDGFRPRRSIVFASWSGGDFGAIGATEWLEGYMSVLHLKICAYISLDKAVSGGNDFKMFGSSMMHAVIRDSIAMVKSPLFSETILKKAQASNRIWEEAVLTPIPVDSSVYAFLAIGGIPTVGLSFVKNDNYPYNTDVDTVDTLLKFTDNKLEAVGRAMAEVVGITVIKLIIHHHLPLDYSKYANEMVDHINKIRNYASLLEERGLTTQWLFSARGAYYRAAHSLSSEIDSSDLNDVLLCRAYNNRIMRVEYHFLSPYVSITSCPYRHLLYGRGHHTLSGILDQLMLLEKMPDLVDFNVTRNDLAYATWTIQGAANALAGEVWTSSNDY